MKFLFASLAFSLGTTLLLSTAFANDGGISAIKVDQIKMRETQIKNGKEEIVRRIVKPSYKITLEGGEAAKLQKILPPSHTVLTAMQPEIAAAYNESFRVLGVYSEKSQQASAKILTINCEDAKLEEAGEGKWKVVKTGKSVCTISIAGVGDSENPSDYFGDMGEFEPKTCQ